MSCILSAECRWAYKIGKQRKALFLWKWYCLWLFCFCCCSNYPLDLSLHVQSAVPFSCLTPVFQWMNRWWNEWMIIWLNHEVNKQIFFGENFPCDREKRSWQKTLNPRGGGGGGKGGLIFSYTVHCMASNWVKHGCLSFGCFCVEYYSWHFDRLKLLVCMWLATQNPAFCYATLISMIESNTDMGDRSYQLHFCSRAWTRI